MSDIPNIQRTFFQALAPGNYDRGIKLRAENVRSIKHPALSMNLHKDRPGCLTFQTFC